MVQVDFNLPVYSLDEEKKKAHIDQLLIDLCQHHYHHCLPYRNFVEQRCHGIPDHADDIPPLSVRLFKDRVLASVPDDQISRMMMSSGTSSNGLSRIALNRQTAANQSRALGKIIQSFTGPQRLPTLLIDQSNHMADKKKFSARAAGLQGLAVFGRQPLWILDEKGVPDWGRLDQFHEQYRSEKILAFGFTFVVWSGLIQALERSGRQYQFENMILLHSGGWKKLQHQAVDRQEFNNRARAVLGAGVQVHNYYGMVEQTGSIHVECEFGFLHTPIFGDVRVRDEVDFSILPIGQQGLLETRSVLPVSYPGHVLLTQDLGIIHGIDDCLCGRKGKRFTVTGRQSQAEVRGCSDSYV